MRPRAKCFVAVVVVYFISFVSCFLPLSARNLCLAKVILLEKKKEKHPPNTTTTTTIDEGIKRKWKTRGSWQNGNCHQSVRELIHHPLASPRRRQKVAHTYTLFSKRPSAARFGGGKRMWYEYIVPHITSAPPDLGDRRNLA